MQTKSKPKKVQPSTPSEKALRKRLKKEKSISAQLAEEMCKQEVQIRDLLLQKDSLERKSAYLQEENGKLFRQRDILIQDLQSRQRLLDSQEKGFTLVLKEQENLRQSVKELEKENAKLAEIAQAGMALKTALLEFLPR